MTSWQRRGRLVAIVVAISVAGAAYWASGARRTVAPPPRVTPLEPTVTAVMKGGEAAQSSGTQEDFSVDFKEQKTYQDGRTVATGLTVRVANRGGKSFVVTGNEGTVGDQQASIAMNGDVVLKASDGLVATAGSATYSNGEGIVRAPGPVTFTSGDTKGAGIGFSYDSQRDTMWLLDQAEVHVAGSAAAGAIDATAGAFGEARRDRYMRMERGTKLVRPGQTIEANEAMVYLFPDRDDPDRIELRGNARITGGEGMGALRAMQARDINLDYGEDGRTVEHATLAGQASVTLAGSAPGAVGQRLTAEFIDIALGPDGAVTSLSSRERVVVTLPATPTTPARTIKSVELGAAGAAGAGLTSMKFDQQVEFTEGATGKTPPTRIAHARTLTLALAAAGALDRATFSGEARFENGTLHAAAAEARYLVTDDQLVLSGREGNARPRVTDTGVQIEGDEITVGLRASTMAAKGEVSSVMQPASARQGEGPGRTPALLDGGQAVFASAAALDYDSGQRRGTYTGRARLWQGDTTIRAERIVLDEARGDLSASGGVQSTLSIASADGAAPPPGGQRGTIARGESMQYEDAARTATYTTAARMSGPQGDLAADRIALVLADGGGRTLERIEGYGAVQARIEAREAKGARLTHLASDGRYVLTGTPVEFTENCRLTTGRTLTFFGSAGRIIVDGNDATRTTTKGGGRCAPPPN
jgi:LPS export ABC transporter protein LptC